MGDLVLYISGLGTPWANGVVGGRLRAEEADESIEWAVGEFESAGVAASWSIGPVATPADLPKRLVAHDFELSEDLAWMAAELGEGTEASVVPPGLVIEEVRTPELHDAWLTAMVEGFESNKESRETLDTLGRHELERGDGSWARFVGLVDDLPVASAGVVLAGGVAGIYNVATLPSARRRGYGTVMSRTAMSRARELGHGIAILGSSDAGRGVYEGLGFRDVCTTQNFDWKPSE